MDLQKLLTVRIGEKNNNHNVVQYTESLNNDALSEDWLKNSTSYIWKVGALTAIDNNKCDWVTVAIGIQRTDKHDPEFIGEMYFSDGENQDIARVLDRAMKMLPNHHPVFDLD